MKAILEFFVGTKHRRKEKQFINPYEAVLALINMNAQLELSYLKEFHKIQKEKEELLRKVTGSEEQRQKDEIVIEAIVINEIVMEEVEIIKKNFSTHTG